MVVKDMEVSFVNGRCGISEMPLGTSAFVLRFKRKDDMDSLPDNYIRLGIESRIS